MSLRMLLLRFVEVAFVEKVAVEASFNSSSPIFWDSFTAAAPFPGDF